ncbi:MAG: RNA chaperone Hfq [bacterium]|nr:RNA chaperone Hfq [bacterium]
MLSPAGLALLPDMPQTGANRLYQDRLLDTAMQKAKSITVYLKNGVHIKGRIVAHDTFTVLIETEKNNTLVYKHSVTSLFPARLHPPRPPRA